jgi:transposase InsO family protein
VKANQAEFVVGRMCRLLGVSPSGYYAWLGRAESARSGEDRVLGEVIVGVWKDSHRTYGAPRIHVELAERGIRVGRKRVARLMRIHQIQGVTRRKRYRTTVRDPVARPAPDLVQRRFQADAPNRIWVADITEIPTGEGPLFLACVQDIWSRRIVGWDIATHMRTELITAALEMAISQRHPTEVVHHSDQGSQYTSVAFGERCYQSGVVPSMGSVGDCYDNAMAESFFATLECELLGRTTLATRQQAQQEVFRWIEGWYNPHRRHSSINYQSPINYERNNWPT